MMEIREVLEKDFHTFSDIGTQLDITGDNGIITIAIIREVERKYNVDLTSGVVVNAGNGARYSSVGALFASQEFADLGRLKAIQRRVLPIQATKAKIPPAGEIRQVAEDGKLIKNRLDIDAIREAIQKKPNAAVKVILIDGTAGVGKTSLIQTLVSERAHAGNAVIPLLHVTARGRRLVSFDDAIARSIQDFRISSFTYEQLPTLLRRGCIQVAIDGFDELADSDGYQNAWYGLSAFLSEAGTASAVILAGRDTFFDEQKFAKSLERFNISPEIDVIRLSYATPESAVTWLNQSGWSISLSQREAQSYFSEGSLLLRPYFLEQIRPFKSFSELDQTGKDPWQIVIDSFIDREARIVAGRLSIPVGNIKECLLILYSEVAADMAERESNRISSETIVFLSEIAFDGIEDEQGRRTVTQSAGSIALFENILSEAEESHSGQMRAFPNETIYNYFLGQAIYFAGLEERSPAFLQRSYFSLEVGEAFAEVIRYQSHVDANQCMSGLQSIYRSARASHFISNVGTMILAALPSLTSLEAINFSGIVAENIRWTGLMPDAHVRDTQITKLDMRGVDAQAITFENVRVIQLIVDEVTRFGRTWPICDVLQVSNEAGHLNIFRRPSEIEGQLNGRIQKNSIDENTLPLVRYFDRLMYGFMRRHIIRDSDGDSQVSLIRHPDWPFIRDVLRDHGRLTVDSRRAAGPNDDFYQIIQPRGLLMPNNEDVEAWSIRNAIVSEAVSRKVDLE